MDELEVLDRHEHERDALLLAINVGEQGGLCSLCRCCCCISYDLRLRVRVAADNEARLSKAKAQDLIVALLKLVTKL